MCSKNESLFPLHYGGWGLGGEVLSFFLAVRAPGVFSCDRQELDMKGTANSKYDLINYICQ